MRKGKLVLGAGPVSVALVCAAAAAAATPATLWVAPNGRDANGCSRAKPCRTIEHAVTVAKAGDTVKVVGGTYCEQVTVDKRLTIMGVAPSLGFTGGARQPAQSTGAGCSADGTGKPIVNALAHTNGFLITGAAAAGSVLRGFVVENATEEGILAVSTRAVTIADNHVTGNDRGASAPSPTGECAPQGATPGDCGEGLHLMGTSSSVVRDNFVNGNSGGILLTDETGPTAHNRLAGNHVVSNLYDCGITLAGHNPDAVTISGPAPEVAGVYANLIQGNVANGNGIKGEGAGIGIFAGAPGTGAYGNTVKGNTADGNGLAGVTLHSHAPGQDLNDNDIINNTVSHDALTGGVNGTPGDISTGPTGDTATTGITVFSAVTKLAGIVITGNRISDVYYGIWTQNAPPVTAKRNHFSHVVVPVHQQ